jgi:hypothetical protein
MNLACSQTSGVCEPAGGMGGMGGMGTGGMGGMGTGGMGMGGMGGMGTGGMGTGGMSGAGGTGGSTTASCPAVDDTGTGCTLTANTSTVSTAPNGCALLARDASACAACRAAMGLGGFWLKFSCRVGMSVGSNGAVQFVRLNSDSQPDYKTDYFQPSNACYANLGTHLNPNRIGVVAVSMNIPLSPNTTPSSLPGTIGLGVNGVLLFSNAAAPGDDIYLEASTFDRCQGHPTQKSVYHYHSEPYSISYDDASFIGVLRDGNPLYGRRDMDGSMPTLDAYGGHTGTTPDSATPVYHYHVNLQTSTSSTSAGMQAWFLTTGTLRGTAGACTGGC